MRDEYADRLTFLSRVGLVVAVAYGLYYILKLDLTPTIPRDPSGLVVGRDYFNFWMAGRAAWGTDPARFYDLATYQAATAPFVGTSYPGQNWSYPPTILLLAAPFGLMPYLLSLALWLAGSATSFALALRRWSANGTLISATLLSPAAVFGVISGQFMFAAGAILLTVMRWREQRPWRAGLLLGLLTIKPQLGLFFPVLLLATRNWRMIAGAFIPRSLSP